MSRCRGDVLKKPSQLKKEKDIKGSVSRELTGVQNGINRKVFLWGCVGRVIVSFLFRCYLVINIKQFSAI